jgi:hypothetical protein
VDKSKIPKDCEMVKEYGMEEAIGLIEEWLRVYCAAKLYKLPGETTIHEGEFNCSGDSSEDDEEEEDDDTLNVTPGLVTPGEVDSHVDFPELTEKPDPVEIPESIKQQYTELWNEFQNRLGADAIKNHLKVTSGSFDKFCIENPITEFNGYKLPEFKGCLDFDELAEESYMKLIRTVLLFMVVMMFISSVFVVLRQY